MPCAMGAYTSLIPSPFGVKILGMVKLAISTTRIDAMVVSLQPFAPKAISVTV